MPPGPEIGQAAPLHNACCKWFSAATPKPRQAVPGLGDGVADDNDEDEDEVTDVESLADAGGGCGGCGSGGGGYYCCYHGNVRSGALF